MARLSRSHFYEFKDAFEKQRRDELAPIMRRWSRMPNETTPEFVHRILQMTMEFPTYSYVRVSQQLRLVSVPASPSKVRGVWMREGLLKRYHRLLWMERRVDRLTGC